MNPHNFFFAAKVGGFQQAASRRAYLVQFVRWHCLKIEDDSVGITRQGAAKVPIIVGADKQ